LSARGTFAADVTSTPAKNLQMTAKILDGKRIADALLDDLQARVRLRREKSGAVPGLAVVLVGDDAASAVYVRNKRRACRHVGFRSRDYDLAGSTSGEELIALIDRLNADADIHGILVQLPLPPHIDANAVVNRIDPRKDVDGFHPENIGRLALRQRGLRPCTSKGVMTLLAHTDRPVRGQDAVVVGVSNHVGRPLAFELLLAGCTTTCCHKFTRDLPKVIGQGDIVIVATGRPGLVRGDWIKPGAVVIDVGINRLADGRLVGDVQFDAAADRASWITPVPGGVGPMTVATLMQNTLEAAELR
jgi:methylenetetrahydrofolate dehydrogenase (NADP+)/methenyltetrahydrofolate cyclohydrolase